MVNIAGVVSHRCQRILCDWNRVRGDDENMAGVGVRRRQRPGDQVAASRVAQIQNLAPAIDGLIWKLRKKVVVILRQQPRLGDPQRSDDRDEAEVVGRDPPQNVAGKTRTVEVIGSRCLVDDQVVLIICVLCVFEDAKSLARDLQGRAVALFIDFPVDFRRELLLWIRTNGLAPECELTRRL